MYKIANIRFDFTVGLKIFDRNSNSNNMYNINNSNDNNTWI
jgi:hypothetical protein